MEQEFLTLNMLRSSKFNPKFPVYAYLFGNFDFNNIPLAPPGTKVVVHLKPEQRAYWDPNDKVGRYIGPSIDHYRCMNFYLPLTQT